jgi:hypothetical protein
MCAPSQFSAFPRNPIEVCFASATRHSNKQAKFSSVEQYERTLARRAAAAWFNACALEKPSDHRLC